MTTEHKIIDPHNPILSCLLGTAVGDALGLPTEGMTRNRARVFHQDSVRHRLVFGRGMFSDDTEHTLMVAVALMRHREDAMAFQKSLGRALRWWMLALPAGVGLSTARAILKLWCGFSAKHSGVTSAGNGAAMRSAIIGAVFANNIEKRQEFARAACRLTHTDPRAEESALLVAEAAALAAANLDGGIILERLGALVTTCEMKERFEKLRTALQGAISVAEYASLIGCEKGVSGFAPNTVAVALYAWLRHHGDFRGTLTAVIHCGGDTDTVAAIAGGICGTELGESRIPAAWLNGICDWPRSVSYIRRIASALQRSVSGDEAAIPRLAVEAILPRNVLFLLIVLFHGFRRLLPPY